MDPFDRLLARFGENAVLIVASMALAVVMKLAGLL